jgi:hypothetical protein
MAVETTRDVARALARKAIEDAGDIIDATGNPDETEVGDYLALTVDAVKSLDDTDVLRYARNVLFNTDISYELLTGIAPFILPAEPEPVGVEVLEPKAIETPPEPEPAPSKPAKAGT